MTTALAHDERCNEHATGEGHPERPDRLTAIVQKLRATHQWDELLHLPIKPAELESITAVHDPAYVRRLQAACEMGESYIDAIDSAVCPRSYDAALLAAGAMIAATDAVMSGRAHNAFAPVRPPGHHCEFDRSMGFCLLNNIAIAAQHLIDRYGLERVAIVDFDVHHGNGTQQLFEDRPDVLFVSIHEHPSYLYPGTGFAWEKGVGEGEGATLNMPLPPGSGDNEYRAAFESKILPALEQFGPQFLLISAGFDAAEHDPLAHQKVSPHGFAWMTRRLKALAEKHCGGRLVSTLEGGYDLRSLAECVSVHLSELMADEGEDPAMAMKAGM
ncbi:MAG: histone deacetylase [Phycisphaeraceae bacterium]|nr:histone deacetylase [Phycisphaeraceae bacterium]